MSDQSQPHSGTTGYHVVNQHQHSSRHPAGVTFLICFPICLAFACLPYCARDGPDGSGLAIPTAFPLACNMSASLRQSSESYLQSNFKSGFRLKASGGPHHPELQGAPRRTDRASRCRFHPPIAAKPVPRVCFRGRGRCGRRRYQRHQRQSLIQWQLGGRGVICQECTSSSSCIGLKA